MGSDRGECCYEDGRVATVSLFLAVRCLFFLLPVASFLVALSTLLDSLLPFLAIIHPIVTDPLHPITH